MHVKFSQFHAQAIMLFKGFLIISSIKVTVVLSPYVCVCLSLTSQTPDVLVSTLRPVARFADLTTEEVADLFVCAHRIAPVLQTLFKSSSLTIAVQDGEHAGQTVDHVHVHLIPRRLGDFKHNDDIYDQVSCYTSHLITPLSNDCA